MYVCELVAHRLRHDGWTVWHKRTQSPSGEQYVVHLYRPGVIRQATAPTLTEAFAEAARCARDVPKAAPSLVEGGCGPLWPMAMGF